MDEELERSSRLPATMRGMEGGLIKLNIDWLSISRILHPFLVSGVVEHLAIGILTVKAAEETLTTI